MQDEGESAGGGAGEGRGWRAEEAALARFAAEHDGVEAYVEPGRTVTDVTVVLVAGSGRWIRRRTASPSAARHLAHQLGIPAFDVTVIGYPQRLRDYTASVMRARSGARDE
ncbi:MAG TPA: hypothetical protein VGX23_02115 [Actinocrinis sp.]|nr:hypothetical protein [Actinocrinis sp.]